MDEGTYRILYNLPTSSLPPVGNEKVCGKQNDNRNNQYMGPFFTPALASIQQLERRQLIISKTHPMETHTAVAYVGDSTFRTMKLPAIPPSPLHAVTAAATVALFHCPTMLFA